MEACKLKTERRVTMEVSKGRFRSMLEMMIKEKTGETSSNSRGLIEEVTKMTFLLYIQSWISQSKIEEQLQMDQNETEDRKDRKSYMIKVEELLHDMGRCEISTMINGYTQGKSWGDVKETYVLRGNIGCEIWFRRFGDIKKRKNMDPQRTGKTPKNHKKRRRILPAG